MATADDESTIEEIALAIWREREIGFPPRVRRFNPDAIDRESGAWQAVVREAHRRVMQSDRPDTTEPRTSA